MPDKVFFDSNILIYAYSIDQPSKQKAVNSLLNKHDTIVISTQTINEFANVMIRKKMMDDDTIPLVVEEFFKNFTIESIDKDTIQDALKLRRKYRYSYFDCLMLASAIGSGCSLLYSEDMHHSHNVDNQLRIINPFE